MPILLLLRTCRRFLAIALACAWAGLAGAAAWTLSVNDANGLPTVTRGGAAAVGTDFAFWGSNYKWASLTTQVRVEAPYTYAIAGQNAPLDFSLAGQVRKLGSAELAWNFTFDAASRKENVIGGGLVFHFNLAAFRAEMGDPVLLPNKLGWAWGSGRDRIEFRFDRPLAALYFERANKEEVRAFFYSGTIPAGRLTTNATFAGSGDVALAPTTGERFGLADTTAWPADILDWRTSPVDLSFLNKPEIPAGRHGFLKAAGERLVFEDGTPVRFWGTNLTAYALFGSSKEGVRQQARRLSQLGFNLVRIHHHDSPWVDPNIFGPASAESTESIAAAQQDRLDWLIKCLKDEGIYVWLDLHAQRFLKPGDNIRYFAEIAKGKASADLKGYNYVNPSIQQAMKDFARAYLSHRNNYTGLRYVDDPAIAMVLLTNENDLTNHYGNALLPDKGVPLHSALYMTLAAKFAAEWGLPEKKIWHAWEPGPSKIFLNDLEHRFDADMIASLRSLGLRVPIATTSTWANNPLFSLPALTSGNVIDAHSYGRVGEIGKNPVYTADFLHWIAAAQVAGRPLTVTEWNVEPFPVPDRHSIPLFVAGAASLQGWDAVMEYAYSQAALDSAAWPSNYAAFNDPGLISTLPAAALLYRQGHVRESPVVYAYAPTPEQLFGELVSAGNAAGLRTAAELGKLEIVMPRTRELPWLQPGEIPRGARVIADPKRSLIPEGASEAVSHTGEIGHSWGRGLYTIATPRTQAATGWLGGKTIDLADINLAITTANASVAVQSLDGRPIRQSRELLISLGARSVPKTPKTLPFYSEPVEGQISIVSVAKGLRLFARDAATGQFRPLPVDYQRGRYIIRADRSFRSYWLFLR